MPDDFIIVWSGGELLPPRASSAWPFEHLGEYFRREPVPAQCHAPGTVCRDLSKWSDEAFRRRVVELVRVGHSQRRVARMLGVPLGQVHQAVHFGRATR